MLSSSNLWRLPVKFIKTPNFIDDNGNEYCGELKNGKPHGKGKMEYYTEDDERETKTYEGGWLNGKKHGKGIEIYQELSECDECWSLANECSCIYSGSCEEKNRGKHYYYTIYNGEWKKDMKHGHGEHSTMVYDFNNWGRVDRTYTGDWKNGLKEGKGILKIPIGYDTVPFIDLESDHQAYCWAHVSEIHYNTYETQWVDDKMNGHCILTDKNGNKFEGTMLNDKEHGIFISKIYYNNGEQLPKHDPKIQEVLAEIEKKKLAVVLNKKVALGTNEDMGEILNSVGY